MTGEPLPSAAMIAAGKCPGFGSDFNFHSRYAEPETTPGRYMADTGRLRVCGRRITRKDLCGICDNRRREAIKHRDAAAQATVQRRILAAKLTTASNVAAMLRDALLVKTGVSVYFASDEEGGLALDVVDGEKLLRWAQT
jgi:hypothetical protein